MADVKDNGGPAFPVREWPSKSGMSLRDYFAGQVLGSVVAGAPIGTPDARITSICYEIADAMLVARGK